MPFTFAHPAAAVPLRRVLGRYGELSALVIGSMAPDFHYFLPFDLDRMETHSFGGIFWFCLPVGLLAYLVWHLLLREPLLELLPERVASRLDDASGKHRPPAPPSAVFVSLLAGVLTHLLWDTFTHAGAIGVRMLPWLRRVPFSVDGYQVHVYKLVQHGSALIGLVLLAVWIARWWRRTGAVATPQPATRAARAALRVRERNRVIAIIACATLAAATWAAFPVLQWPLDPPVLRLALREAVITAIDALLVCLLLYSAGWHARGRAERA